MGSLRLWHSYLGMLLAPSVLFFALTGALQIYNLHEAHGRYSPPPLIEKLSSVHKDQIFALHEHQGPQDAAGAAAPPANDHPPDEEEEAQPLGTVLLKAYFLMIAIGLIASTILGLWMGLTQVRNKRIGISLLVVGSILPVVLIIL
jgi:hypothetical protein